MAEFMDVHTSMVGVTPQALAAAHQADLDIQGDEGVNFKQAWADPKTGHVFCLSEAPSAEAVRRIHERAGHPADEIHEITVTA
jgi:ferredoxin-NADP reductase